MSKAGLGAALQVAGQGLMQYTQLSIEEMRQKNLEAIRQRERGEDAASRDARFAVEDTRYAATTERQAERDKKTDEQFDKTIGYKKEVESANAARDAAKEQRGYAHSERLASQSQASAKTLKEMDLEAAERNRTGKILSSADRGKLIVEYDKTLRESPEMMRKPSEETLNIAKKRINELYPEASAPAASPAASKAEFIRTGTDANGRKVGMRADGTIVDIATGRAVK